MTTFVIRDGQLVEKQPPTRAPAKGALPVPHVSRMTPYESPVTGREIFSHRERDADMRAVGACDPRDLPRAPFEKRKADNAARANLPDA